MAPQPPTGRVTMLFTDIEGSTRLARLLGDEWPGVLADHHDIVGSAITQKGGYIDGTEGDAFFAVFEGADAAVAAATTAQRGLRAHAWPATAGELRVRMGLHTADVERRNDHYVGLDVHRAARVGAAANGGQVLLTRETYTALAPPPPCDDLGAHRLKDFPEPTHLFHLVIDGVAAQDVPPPRTLDVRPTNLPSAQAQLVARRDEIAAARHGLAVEGVRVLTLAGLGGAGKTTTAIALGHDLLGDYPGGVWMVRAESLTRADELVEAIASALWVRDVPGLDLLDALVERLAPTRTLLVLDNLEQISGAAEVVLALIERVASVTILTTSRTALRLSAEHVMVLGPLPLDAAIELLLQRARSAGAVVDTDAGAARSTVGSLCERLGCLPLALEIVAPRLRLFTAAEMLDRLGSIADLESTAVDAPARHKSLRSTVEWSVGLLDEGAQILFRRMAVIEHPMPIDVIDAVCGRDIDAVQGLASLLDHSLVRRDAAGLALVTAVREVADALLAASGERDELRRSHATAMAASAEALQTLTPTQADPPLLALCADAWTAAGWARAADVDLHRRIVIGYAASWALSGQLRRALDEVATTVRGGGADDADLAELWRLEAYLLVLAGRGEEAEVAAQEAVRLSSAMPPGQRWRAHIVLAQAATIAGHWPDGLAAATRGLALARELGSAASIARALVEVAQTSLTLGDAERAGQALDEAEDLATRDADDSLIEMVTMYRADWAVATGDLLGSLRANLLGLDGAYAGWTVASIAVALVKLGRASEALELGAAADAMARELGTEVDTYTLGFDSLDAAMDRARADLPVDEAARAERAGRELAPGQRSRRARDIVERCLSEIDRASTTS